MRRRLFAAGVALLAGCNGITGGCTLIGCANGLIVNLAQAPTSAYRIEVFAIESGPHFIFECANPAQCGPGAAFNDFMPEAVTIRVTTSAGTREETVHPTYDVSQPNGPNCGPECRQAQGTVALPG